MYDIHCHMLYGVDDGAAALNEAVEMAKIAFENGTRAIAVTPHANLSDDMPGLWDESLKNKLRELKNALKDAEIPLALFPGQEILCRGDFLEKLKNGLFTTLNGSVYPLVEFGFNEQSKKVTEKLASLCAEGFVPVVAHPERYGFVAEDFSALVKIKRMGCLLQLDKGSLRRHFGKTAHDSAAKILRNELADVVSSDAHSPYLRSPSLCEVHEYIAERYGLPYAQQLLSVNPQKIVENKQSVQTRTAGE